MANDPFSDGGYRVPESVRARMMAAEALRRTAAGNLGPYSSPGLAIAQGLLGLAGGLKEGYETSQEEAAQQQSAQRLATAWSEKYSNPAARALAEAANASTAGQTPGQIPGSSPTLPAGISGSRDLAIRTIYGEAGGEPEQGQIGVASVLKNRLASGQYGKDVSSVITAPKQFSLWNPGDPAGDTARKLSPHDPAYQKIGALYDGVMSGQIADPTGGATHYYNPGAASPTWGPQLAQQNDVTIGNHRFVGGGIGPGAAPKPPASATAANPPVLSAYTKGGAISDADLARYNSDRQAFIDSHGLANAAPAKSIGPQASADAQVLAGGAGNDTLSTARGPFSLALNGPAARRMSPDAAALLSPNPMPAGLPQPALLGNGAPPPSYFSGGIGDPMSAGRALNAGIDGTGIGADGTVPPPAAPAPAPPPMQPVLGPSGPDDPANATDYAMSPTGPRQDFAPAVSMGGLPPAGASDGPPNPVAFNPAMLGPQQGSPDGMGSAMLPATAPLPGPGVQSPDALALLQGSGAANPSMMPPPPSRTPQGQAAAQASFDAVRNPDGSLPHEFGGLHPNANPAGVVTQAGHPMEPAAPVDAQGYADPSTMASTPAQQAIRSRMRPSADALALAGGAGNDAVQTSPMWTGGQGGNDPSSAMAFLRSQGSQPTSLAARALLDRGSAPASGPSPSPGIMAKALDPNYSPTSATQGGSSPLSGMGSSLMSGLGNLFGGGQQSQISITPPPGSNLTSAQWQVLQDQRIDPATKRMLLQQPTNEFEHVMGQDGRLYAFNKQTGAFTAVPGQAAVPGSSPLTAQDRQQYGLGADQNGFKDQKGEIHLFPTDQSNAPTADQKDYRQVVADAQKNGQAPPSFEQYQLNRARAASSAPTTGQEVFKQVAAAKDDADAAARSLPSYAAARQAIQGGALLGAGADYKLGGAKILSAFGQKDAGDSASNTEVFRSAVAPIVLADVKALGSGSGISNADREFAEKAAGGNINLEPQSINRLLDIGERAARARIQNYQSTYDAVYPASDPQNAQARALFQLRMPPGADGGPATPGTPAPSAAPAAPRSKAAYDALPSGTPFTAPDGSVRRKP